MPPVPRWRACLVTIALSTLTFFLGFKLGVGNSESAAAALPLTLSLVSAVDTAAPKAIPATASASTSYSPALLQTSSASASSTLSGLATPTGIAPARPPYRALMISVLVNGSGDAMWATAHDTWAGRLPHLERFPAYVLPKGRGSEAIRMSTQNAILTLETNSDPFVLVMEDDAAPFPEFDELWPEVVAELLARAGDWDFLHGCPQFQVRSGVCVDMHSSE